MKKHSTKSVPLGGAFWDGGSETFINKGTNNRWKDILPKEDSDRYEKISEHELGKEAARWLNTGKI
jgi:aryl sulfotransferase